MTWKSYALLSVPGLVATYLMSTPARPEPPSREARRVEAARSEASEDIQELAIRLQSRVRAEAAFQEPIRNPFRFSARRPSERVAAEAAAAAAALIVQPAAPVLPPLPPLTLVGMASDEVDGTVQRTAIINTGLDVVLVREGDSVGRDYRVSKVEADGVELTTIADGTIRRLSLKP